MTFGYDDQVPLFFVAQIAERRTTQTTFVYPVEGGSANDYDYVDQSTTRVRRTVPAVVRCTTGQAISKGGRSLLVDPVEGGSANYYDIVRAIQLTAMTWMAKSRSVQP